jgi:hypothetical protein
MEKIIDKAFGELTFDKYRWSRGYNISFLGKENQITLLIEGDKDAEIEPSQKAAFEAFEKEKDRLIQEAECSLFSYYQSVCSDYREKAVGNLADINAPLVHTKEQLQQHVQPESLLFPEALKKDERIIGLLLTCTWEPEHGVAIKFLNGEVCEVGFQDIVL